MIYGVYNIIKKNICEGAIAAVIFKKHRFRNVN